MSGLLQYELLLRIVGSVCSFPRLRSIETSTVDLNPEISGSFQRCPSVLFKVFLVAVVDIAAACLMSHRSCML